MAVKMMPQASQINAYLRKHQLAPLQIRAAPDPQLGAVVVIPSRDEPQVTRTLASLSACRPPGVGVEVLLVVNGAADADLGERARNARSAALARDFAASARCPPGLRIQVLEYPDLAPREAGVGLARRLGMDEALARLGRVGRADAPIIGLDADCRVADNYLVAIVDHFRQQPRIKACSIYFEHPLDGDLAPPVYRAIGEYELYLRYFRLGLARAGYPFAHHTLGSCMAVRASAYRASGGMNRRQGAEDFHFLSKLMLLGGFSDLNTTRVYPGARPSQRVPFGTGQAVARRLRETSLLVCAPEVFDAIAALVQAVSAWAQQAAVNLEPGVEAYFQARGLTARLAEVRRETASVRAFEKRLYRWLNPLCMVKFANHLSAGRYPRIPVAEAAGRLLGGGARAGPRPVLKLLRRYRKLEQMGSVSAL